MSYDSMPSYEEAPSFDEVVAYAVKNDLFGKVSLVRFYEYYGDFKYKGITIDWKTKLQEWAQRQRSKVQVTAKEYEAYNRVVGKVAQKKQESAASIWAKVAMI